MLVTEMFPSCLLNLALLPLTISYVLNANTQISDGADGTAWDQISNLQSEIAELRIRMGQLVSERDALLRQIPTNVKFEIEVRRNCNVLR